MALDQALYDLPEDYYSRYLERVQAVTLEQANASVQNRLSVDDILVTVVGTNSVIGDAVRDAVVGLASAEVVPFDRVD